MTSRPTPPSAEERPGEGRMIARPLTPEGATGMALGVNEARVAVMTHLRKRWMNNSELGDALDGILYGLERHFWRRHEELSKKKASPTKRGKRGRKS